MPLCFVPASAEASEQSIESSKLAGIHSVAIISLLGNDVDMRTQGTMFDRDDYKLHTDWNLDDRTRAAVEQALSIRFHVEHTPIDTNGFSTLETSFLGDISMQVSQRIAALSPKPKVDAIIAIYPNETDVTRYISPGMSVTRGVPFLFHSATTDIAATYAVGVFNPVTGERIDYGTARMTGSGISGYSAPVMRCSNALWSETEAALTTDQKSGIKTELWSLISKSLPHALNNAGLISSSEENALSASISSEGDASCHPW